MDFIIVLIAILIAPLTLFAIDAYVVYKSKAKHYTFRDTHHHDFTVLVPIYGNIKYLENANYLKQYGGLVMLVTTGGETKEFNKELNKIAKKHSFKIYRAKWIAEQDPNTRSTSGTIRDRLIRDALKEVKTEYVVPLDADSVTSQPISIAISELVAESADIASVRLVLSNADKNWLTKIQKLEYRISMNMRFVIPWLISGACQVAKTSVLTDIMNRHSTFFQGNDVEIGLLAKSLRYKVVHIPFQVETSAPERIKPWLRQRLAWAAGEFRLFIINFRYIYKHPFFWFYGAILVILAFPLRYLAIYEHTTALYIVLGLYILLIYIMHWKNKHIWLLVMPVYTLFTSIILVPLGIVWYVLMAFRDRNIGIISPNRIQTSDS